MHVVVMGCVCQSLIKKLLTYLLTYEAKAEAENFGLEDLTSLG